MRIVEWLVAEIYEVVVCPFVLSSPSNFCLLLTRLHWSTCPKVAKRDTWQLICDISSFFDEFVASDLMQTAWWKLQALENALSWAVTEMAMIVFLLLRILDFAFLFCFLDVFHPGWYPLPDIVVGCTWDMRIAYARYVGIVGEALHFVTCEILKGTGLVWCTWYWPIDIVWYCLEGAIFCVMTCFQNKMLCLNRVAIFDTYKRRPLVAADDGVMKSPNHIAAAVVFLEMRETVGPAT